jgi:hypothetical protein
MEGDDDNNTSSFDSSSETFQDRLTRMKTIESTLSEIAAALDDFEKTFNQSKMKEAASKIKATAPILKQIATAQEYKEDETLNSMVTKCRKEMKTLFERAKKVTMAPSYNIFR